MISRRSLAGSSAWATLSDNSFFTLDKTVLSESECWNSLKSASTTARTEDPWAKISAWTSGSRDSAFAARPVRSRMRFMTASACGDSADAG